MEEINQDEKEKIREEEIRKILKELRKEKHASYSSHDSYKSLSEEFSDYYRGRNRSPYFHLCVIILGNFPLGLCVFCWEP